MVKIYKVGGCVRDKLLGINSKDIDFVFVISDLTSVNGVEGGFKMMESYMTQNGYTIFLSTPDCYTIRAKFPSGHKYDGMVADFVLARKEVGYYSGTRRPILELGTLNDDLIRRDFTLNAMAEDEEGNIIDLFGGKEDLKNGILKTPVNCFQTFDDDPLRILRAIRFSITKGFKLSTDIHFAIHQYEYDEKMGVVSGERIREELLKCFKHDTQKTLEMLFKYFKLKDYIFTKTNLWLKPTFEL
jgi:tRNA nucleotidyltransferase/poly(A) polymerase